MPYILNTQKDIKKMLEVIGVNSLDELYSSIPSSIKLKEPLNIPSGRSELDTKKALEELANKNTPLNEYNSFLGAGCYDHYLPASLMSILSLPQFLTAYTPYQAECSQGILQAIYEYQTYICLLTGMDVSNASLLDGASSLAEAVLMSLRITKGKKVIIPESLHPEYRQTLETYLAGFDFILQELKVGREGFLSIESFEKKIDADIGCWVIQSPNFFGLIEDVGKLSTLAHQNGALVVLVTNPLSLALLKEPGSLGVDIVCGDAGVLGSGLNLGGPSLGFLATKKEYLRQVPGRIVGKTVDKEGNSAYCLTLQTREQHIRREKATSNICSNHSLKAIGAAVYLSLMGSEGLGKIALFTFSNTQYLYKRLRQVRGVNIPYPPRIFNEFLWEVEDAPQVLEKLYEKNIIAGYLVGDLFKQHKNGILSCCSEKKTKDDIDNFVNALAELLHG